MPGGHPCAAGDYMGAACLVREDGRVHEVTLRNDVIRLGQLLKLVDVVDSGSDVKALLAQGVVTVNGEVETRRGRQLVAGDLVSALGVDVRVVRDVN